MFKKFLDYVGYKTENTFTSIREFFDSMNGLSFLNGMYRLFKTDDIDKWNNYAKQLNIITTIGSDFHNFDSIHPIVGLINEDINLTLNDINNILYNLNN